MNKMTNLFRSKKQLNWKKYKSADSSGKTSMNADGVYILMGTFSCTLPEHFSWCEEYKLTLLSMDTLGSRKSLWQRTNKSARYMTIRKESKWLKLDESSWMDPHLRQQLEFLLNGQTQS